MSQEEVRAAQRRRRRDARRRILDSAQALLEEHPWHAIPLEAIMTRAELTRTTFYRHFDDRELLLIALLQEVGVHLDAAGEPWKRGAADPAGELRRNLTTLTSLFVDHGRLLQAISDASDRDSDLRGAYLRLADDLVATTAARIAAEVQAGRSAVQDAEQVAAALVWMNERYLLRCFGRRPFTADPDTAAAALAEIWVTTIYGREPGPR
ncbi:MAG TPA: TetR/AcrR family transcriptional regulator [Solirubrobacteraceae bacterium]|nr:TetR/AcrR family transcriptional regulator [Solirubrobacteraceae bacterium]